ncbi:hypothetical protein ABZ746_06710 [Streptomyces sp. NPDC020096]
MRSHSANSPEASGLDDLAAGCALRVRSIRQGTIPFTTPQEADAPVRTQRPYTHAARLRRVQAPRARHELTGEPPELTWYS